MIFLAGSRLRWSISALVIAAIVAIVGFMLAGAHGTGSWTFGLAAEDIKQYAEAWAPWSAFASMGLMVLHSFVPLPAEIIAVANGMMFGFVGGILVTWAGAMLGAILSFALARSFGRPALRWMVSEERWRKINRWEFRPSSLLLARLIPVISFNLINYAAGLARVGWWPFLWTTAVGILPLTVASVSLGDAMLQASWLIAGVIVAGLVLLWLIFRHRHMQRTINNLFISDSAPPMDD
ncbi:MAG: TVP38/TMEM64 family protein [Pseudolabrys sp.]|jgi:uncharacterized membrane protein YdjX (TVP38/TMEM64 family)|nr:TVP38/TMEM64 family protein [Pseudolabrys sp.]